MEVWISYSFSLFLCFVSAAVCNISCLIVYKCSVWKCRTRFMTIFRWDESVELPIKYSSLPSDTCIGFHVVESVRPGTEANVAGCTVPLFCRSGYVKSIIIYRTYVHIYIYSYCCRYIVQSRGWHMYSYIVIAVFYIDWHDMIHILMPCIIIERFAKDSNVYDYGPVVVQIVISTPLLQARVERQIVCTS